MNTEALIVLASICLGLVAQQSTRSTIHVDINGKSLQEFYKDGNLIRPQGASSL